VYVGVSKREREREREKEREREREREREYCAGCRSMHVTVRPDEMMMSRHDQSMSYTE
jgi:hypothetical protein